MRAAMSLLAGLALQGRAKSSKRAGDPGIGGTIVRASGRGTVRRGQSYVTPPAPLCTMVISRCGDPAVKPS
ncbi:hypothetical protein Ahu01nite_094540 [Winogradskya humida]|uniref:Secreted protein n=1 Tax=Winogradskya humida TaxID=113566 RepID=A0ABQ4A667_9ACTN|nr:hypothetical protein Ahu01nite_094540 [Actinoplanes humidus]